LSFYAKPVGSGIYKIRLKNIKTKEIRSYISLIVSNLKNIFKKMKIYLLFDNMCSTFDMKYMKRLHILPILDIINDYK
jgi:hypothetical protein